MECQMEIDGIAHKVASTDQIYQWNQWQLLDSILPTGGFAHSYGLEAAVQARLLLDQEDLKAHIIQILENTGSLLLPFVYKANQFPDMETWSMLDKTLEATLTNEVSRKASTTQGSALLRVSAVVFPEIDTLKKMREFQMSLGVVSVHHAAVFGLLTGLLGFDPETSQRAYMFMTMRDTISAATRLNLIGPLGAAILQHQVSHVAERIVKRFMNRPIDEACQVAPLLDTVQGCHLYLFSRMFCS